MIIGKAFLANEAIYFFFLFNLVNIVFNYLFSDVITAFKNRLNIYLKLLSTTMVIPVIIAKFN